MPLFSNTFSSPRVDSAPPSRPSSPTRQVTRSSIGSSHSGPSATYPTRTLSSTGSGIGIGTTSSILTGNSALDAADLDAHPEPPSPAYGPYTPSTDSMGWSTPYGNSGANTPGGYFMQHHPVEIHLDSDHLVMRGQGGDMNPAYLSGRVELELGESTNIREIHMTLVGKAKVQFTDFSSNSSKSHHFNHPVYHYDWSFLAGDKRHTHTLKAGHHSWPFQLMLDGALPSTIHTYNGEACIQYKLRATVVRSGFTHSNWTTSKMFWLQRTYTPDALEFNQTLEIENTWPGKIMYSLTLPYKAYAAGDEIPVNVKFMPLAKGVRVTAVSSVLKEYTTVHTRHSTHSDSRVAASCKHELSHGHATLVCDDAVRPPAHSAGTWTGYSSRRGSTDRIRLASQSDAAGPSNVNRTDEELAREADDIMIGDDEVNTALSIRIPPWTTPSHAVHPAYVSHKLKWSCTITNPDGHISELRCALPILILDHSMLDEARAAGASTRALLFGGGEEDEVAQIDLPSYSNHVYDRVAADSGPATGYTSRSSRTPTGGHTPASATPPHSRPVSRAGSRASSPTGRRAQLDEELNNPPRPELPSGTDTELLRALGALELAQSPSPTHTPPESRGASRPLSRRSSFGRSGRSSMMGSRVGSRAGSRASSPERAHAQSSSSGGTDDAHRRQGFSGRLHLPAFKPLRPQKPILRGSSTALADEGSVPRNASFPALACSPTERSASGNHVSFHPSTSTLGGRRARVNFSLADAGGGGAGPSSAPVSAPSSPAEERERDPMTLTPSYDIAARGFASAMDTGLPTYDDSNLIERTKSELSLTRNHRSDGALVDLGAAAAARAEHRAADGQEGEEEEGGEHHTQDMEVMTPRDDDGQINF